MIRPADTAIGHKYIQHNHVNSKLWLTYDIDRPFCIEELHNDLDLPVPNLFIRNPENNRAHIAYSLSVPVHLNDGSSQKPIRFAGAIDCAYQKALRADRGYAGLVMKNPLHEHWDTTEWREESYTLHELSEHVDLEPYADRRKKLEDYGLGRNCTLFENLRRWAYKHKRFFTSGDAFFQAVLEQSDNLSSQFAAPLPHSEVLATAKSVSRWTWRYYEGNGQKNRGRDALQGSQLDLHDKQVLSAAITNRQRSEATETAIKTAILRLQAVDKKITIASVAKQARIHRNTVSKYKDLIL